MNKQISLRDRLLLFSSKHKWLCKLWSYVKYAKISVGLDSGVKQQIDQSLDTFLKNSCGGGG